MRCDPEPAAEKPVKKIDDEIVYCHFIKVQGSGRHETGIG